MKSEAILALCKLQFNKVIGLVALFYFFLFAFSSGTNPVVWQISYTFTQLFPSGQDYVAEFYPRGNYSVDYQCHTANFVPLNHFMIICLDIYIISQGSYWSWKTRKVMGFNCWSWKIIVCVVCKLLQAWSKDNKVEAAKL